VHIGELRSNIHYEPVSNVVEEWVLEIHICGHIGDCQVIDAA
jgi:hypothetical protein